MTRTGVLGMLKVDAVEVDKGPEHKGLVCQRKEFRFICCVMKSLTRILGKGVTCSYLHVGQIGSSATMDWSGLR